MDWVAVYEWVLEIRAVAVSDAEPTREALEEGVGPACWRPYWQYTSRQVISWSAITVRIQAVQPPYELSIA